MYGICYKKNLSEGSTKNIVDEFKNPRILSC